MGSEDESEPKETEEGKTKSLRASKKDKLRAVVKGYMRPDGTSYYVVVPKEVRERLGLKGGEYFVMKADPSEGKISLTRADVLEE